MKWYWILLIGVGAFLLGWWISRATNKKASLPANTTVTSTTTTAPETVVSETADGTEKTITIKKAA